jgi:hypothetical protein
LRPGAAVDVSLSTYQAFERGASIAQSASG